MKQNRKHEKLSYKREKKRYSRNVFLSDSISLSFGFFLSLSNISKSPTGLHRNVHRYQYKNYCTHKSQNENAPNTKTTQSALKQKQTPSWQIWKATERNRARGVILPLRLVVAGTWARLAQQPNIKMRNASSDQRQIDSAVRYLAHHPAGGRFPWTESLMCCVRKRWFLVLGCWCSNKKKKIPITSFRLRKEEIERERGILIWLQSIPHEKITRLVIIESSRFLPLKSRKNVITYPSEKTHFLICHQYLSFYESDECVYIFFSSEVHIRYLLLYYSVSSL